MRDLRERTQAILLALPLVTFPVVALTTVDAMELQAAGVAEATRAVEGVSAGVAAQIDAFHASRLRDLRQFASSAPIAALCTADDAQRQALLHTAHAGIDAWMANDGDLLGASIFSTTGVVLASSVRAAEGMDVSFRSYIRSAQAGRTEVSELFRALPIGGSGLTVGYTMPVTGADGQGCLVGLFAKADAIEAMVREAGTRWGRGCGVVLLDQHGIRVAVSMREDELALRPAGELDPDEIEQMVKERRFGESTRELLTHPVAAPEIFALAREGGAGRTASFTGFSALLEQDSLSAVSPLSTAPWTVGIHVAWNELDAPVWAAVQRSALLGAAILLCGIVGAVLLANVRARRVRAMATAADALGAGRNDVRVGDDGADELGRVAQRFDAMADAIASHLATLEERVRERTAALLAANEELRAQREELQRQATELEAQANTLRAQTHELEAHAEEQRAQAMELERRNTEITRADLLKSEFLSNMSHELRTPLNAVIGFAELLSDSTPGELSDRQREYVQAIAQAGRHQLALINDILDLSKIEAGHMVLEPESVEPRELLSAAVAAISPIAGSRGIPVVMECTAEGRVRADPRRVQQVLLNLLSNAVKFSPAGDAVQARAHDSANGVSFEVLDRGPGISEELRPRLFQPFQQAESPLVKSHQGTGLGLAICRRLVELHGGTIEATPREGGGLRVHFELPAAAEAASKVGSPPRSDSPPRLRRVLVIDDDPAVGRILEGLLQRQGIAVRAHETGRGGLAAAAADPPDAFIVDLALPDMSGLDVVTSLRAAAATAPLPILVLSGDDPPAPDAARLRALGVTIVRKGDVSAEALRAGLERVVGAAASPGVAGPTALVVDDHDLNRALLRELLRRRGLRVIEASDAVTGMAMARAEQPAVIFMDLAMPGLDGYAATRALKADAATRAIPVVVLTAMAMRRDEQAAFEAGADAFLTKPVDAAQLWSTVQRLLPGVMP